MRSFDELYFISDLHLGGPPGCQVFNQSAKLAAFVRYIAERDAGRRVVLVLGGDIIDFLAFDAPYLKPTDQASRLLDQVLADSEFKQIFEALSGFLRRPNRYVVALPGNHDLELMLSAVREQLIDALCGTSDEARGRLVFIDDDGGFRCRIGPSRVVCTHGNEVDSWNLVDYAKLAKRCASEERGLAPEDWQANAGTRLVIDVMNSIKRRFPFVDLLKPEVQLVPRILTILEPAALGSLSRIAPILYRLVHGELHFRGFLGGPERGAEPSHEEMLDDLLNLPSPTSIAAPDTRSQLDPLELAASAVREGKTALALPEGPAGTLGVFQYGIDRLRGVDSQEALRRALNDWLGDEQTVQAFDLDKRDEVFVRLARTVGPEVDFLIAGHTHLARALTRPDGRYYFNAGTWMRIVRLEKAEDLQPQNFGAVYEALRKGTLEALDQARPQIVHTRPTVVVIEAQAGGTTAQGALCEFRNDPRAPLPVIGGPFVIGGGAA